MCTSLTFSNYFLRAFQCIYQVHLYTHMQLHRTCIGFCFRGHFNGFEPALPFMNTFESWIVFISQKENTGLEWRWDVGPRSPNFDNFTMDMRWMSYPEGMVIHQQTDLSQLDHEVEPVPQQPDHEPDRPLSIFFKRRSQATPTWSLDIFHGNNILV